jgi:hypothetical protein
MKAARPYVRVHVLTLASHCVSFKIEVALWNPKCARYVTEFITGDELNLLYYVPTCC